MSAPLTKKLKMPELFSASLKARMWPQPASERPVTSDCWASLPCAILLSPSGVTAEMMVLCLLRLVRSYCSSCLAFWLGSALTLGKANCRAMSTLTPAAHGGVHGVRNRGLLPPALSWAPEEAHPPAQSSLGWLWPLERLWARTTQLSAPGFLTYPYCVRYKCSLFSLHSLGAICYTAIGIHRVWHLTPSSPFILYSWVRFYHFL